MGTATKAARSSAKSATAAVRAAKAAGMNVRQIGMEKRLTRKTRLPHPRPRLRRGQLQLQPSGPAAAPRNGTPRRCHQPWSQEPSAIGPGGTLRHGSAPASRDSRTIADATGGTTPRVFATARPRGSSCRRASSARCPSCSCASTLRPSFAGTHALAERGQPVPARRTAEQMERPARLRPVPPRTVVPPGRRRDHWWRSKSAAFDAVRRAARDNAADPLDASRAAAGLLRPLARTTGAPPGGSSPCVTTRRTRRRTPVIGAGGEFLIDTGPWLAALGHRLVKVDDIELRLKRPVPFDARPVSKSSTTTSPLPHWTRWGRDCRARRGGSRSRRRRRTSRQCH